MAGRTNAIDMHCDTISELWEYAHKGKEVHLRKNTLHIDLERLKDNGYLLQNFALFVHLESVEDPWVHVKELYEVYRAEMEQNRDLISPVHCYRDIERNRAEGKLSALLTVEEGAVCKGDLEKLRELYGMGVRMMTFTWNYPNELASPNMNPELGRKVRTLGKELKELRESGRTDEEYSAKEEELRHLALCYWNTPNVSDGLTETGKIFLGEMERLGMIPDVSHLSDAGFWDVADNSTKPFVASHSNARAICPHARNLTDDMIRALANKGGVMGLNFCADFLIQKPAGVPNPGSIADIVAHAKHIANVGGIEVLGLGSDFDGIETHKELAGAQGMGKLAEALVKGGFHASEVDKIFYENVLRLYREIL